VSTTSSHHSGHRPDQPAPLKPQTPRVWVVRWVVANGTTTKQHFYLTHHSAAKFLGMLLSAGRDVAMFETDVDWREVTP